MELYLFVDGVSLAEYKVSSEKSSYERVSLALLPAVGFFLDEQECLVQSNELG